MALVLVVDDEADLRELVRINLEMVGHTVLTAADGAEGLEAVEVERPDLVILDVMMPEVDGWEVLRTLKASEPELARIPVLMLTARSDDLDRIRGRIEGAVFYLTKPFSLTDLRAKINEALAGEPEPVQRRRAQQEALTDLARLEKANGAGGELDNAEGEATAMPRERISGLGRVAAPPAETPAAVPVAPELLMTLSDKQRELVAAVAGTETVSAAAAQLGVSRSNVYASLRRIARKLQVRSVSELVRLARAGSLRPR